MKLKLLSFLLTAAIAGSANAAFYVDEDSPQQTALQVASARTPQTYGVPFFIKRVQLGPIGRQALQGLLADARTADNILVVGQAQHTTARCAHGDGTDHDFPRFRETAEARSLA